MADFWITLSDERFESDGEMVALGSIKLGEFQEDFRASLSYWDRESYRAQWRQALQRLADGAERSALVTSMYDPKCANFITWWPVYRDGETLRFQNQVLFLTELSEPFDEADPYRSIAPRERLSEDGSPISEWNIKISEISACLKG